jgi:hypothetical protein
MKQTQKGSIELIFGIAVAAILLFVGYLLLMPKSVEAPTSLQEGTDMMAPVNNDEAIKMGQESVSSSDDPEDLEAELDATIVGDPLQDTNQLNVEAKSL